MSGEQASGRVAGRVGQSSRRRVGLCIAWMICVSIGVKQRSRCGASSQEFWLPDGIGAISSVRAASLSDMTDKLPGPRPVRADVQVDTGEVVVPGVASAEDGSSRVACKRFRERCQSWLRTETGAIDLMLLDLAVVCGANTQHLPDQSSWRYTSSEHLRPCSRRRGSSSGRGRKVRQWR
jgi:hypothetical protein